MAAAPARGLILAAAPKLLRAYRETCYTVRTGLAGDIAIRIGKRSAAADRLLRSHGVRTAVLVTAYNPYSRVMPAAWNRRMQLRLRQALRRRDCLCAHGTLRHWSEAHWLVFGDPRPVRKLACLYRQNGIVILRRGQPTHL